MEKTYTAYLHTLGIIGVAAILAGVIGRRYATRYGATEREVAAYRLGYHRAIDDGITFARHG